ncbi:molecular chaperone HtpG [Anaeromassilibacillus sp. An172]|uniref:molecular chaperone HtpG n=1 Tax=Anaeromassilibacillus sp. An172 TaxID=1965570 RepID=UPI000B38BC93|nr:molecular chaperone HtpG [Anaeromassilibacillus sp. An172]MEE0763018.1 molecular chaperone HtpG [Acutalibacteraceae bacterium]OUP76717.1 molecular chaperone HtpG [Anaeromassilibacillus sp. An172]
MEKMQFKSESKRLLDLMINSIYTHREIFLREIISNASDAIDKLCFISLTDDKVGMSRSDFKILIKADKENRTLTVSDNGIGMDKDELENNLGTIASSGSYKFRQQLKDEDKENVDIIGQFGVGFYSAFMVAKEITVITRKYGSDTGYKWQSAGADGYTIEEYNKDTVGTDIIMVLKDDTEEDKYSEYLEQYRLSSLIKKYSDYIRYPIEMDMESTKVKEGTEEKPEYETVVERKTLNSMVPIWQKAKKDVTKEEYNNFYKEKFFDFEDPLLTITTSVEGVVTYKALLYIPAKTPYNYYTKEYEKGLQLYSSGVMIMENCPDLLPEHFRFVKGVVDSQDLSLNISREMLQHNRQLKLIEEHLEKKIKNELASMLKKDRENYEKFFAAFGRQLKYGLVSDYGAHKDKLSDLILFYSYNQKKLITLDEYVEAMKEDQKYIYFATGESKEIIETLPQTEILKDKGFDFLCCTDEIDEFALNSLRTFKEKEFRSVLNDDLGIESENKEEEKEEGQDALITFIKETLGDKVSQVVASKKLKSHPVCLTAQGGISFEMEKYFSVVQPESGMKAQRVLEINMSHPAVKALKDKVTTNIEEAKKYVQLLYSQSLLIAGLPLENPSEYTDLVCSLMI